MAAEKAHLPAAPGMGVIAAVQHLVCDVHRDETEDEGRTRQHPAKGNARHYQRDRKEYGRQGLLPGRSEVVALAVMADVLCCKTDWAGSANRARASDE
jgi:hypothetical protein